MPVQVTPEYVGRINTQISCRACAVATIAISAIRKEWEGYRFDLVGYAPTKRRNARNPGSEQIIEHLILAFITRINIVPGIRADYRIDCGIVRVVYVLCGKRRGRECSECDQRIPDGSKN